MSIKSEVHELLKKYEENDSKNLAKVGKALSEKDTWQKSIIDENGEEVNYSTVDSTGVFYISGLAPGNYTLKLDEKFIDAYGLEMLPEKSEISISIPYDYKTPVDFTEQNLEYKTLAL